MESNLFLTIMGVIYLLALIAQFLLMKAQSAKLEITAQELATVIIALQVWRGYAASTGVQELFNAQFCKATPLTQDEIDDLVNNKLKCLLSN